ncbi:alpha/beta-hydrolase family protein [Hoeflea sp. WL0058]|uniref:Alpha/beta-hydrolase family protein n=1 Tax=Flavimaribacter sediminis TaxID=2865987 RepID=A0AAE2ZIM9_9HYPH|nr:alpha/beta-hydrolase family protein [Flavimaribacter sediminis]MBW8637384.1 alpha/beta-hydrolase family protein [Flavimaribacter sediminis]
MQRILSPFSSFGVLLGLLFLAASLTPSLIPRDPVLQGALGGIVMALGYLAWRIVELLWTAADMPVLRGRLLHIVKAIAAVAVLVVLALSLRYALLWQNDIRARMGMEPVDDAHLVQMLLIALVVFLVLFGVGALIAFFSRFVRARLHRVMPPRRANVLGLVIVFLVLFVVTRDGLLDTAISAMDEAYEAGQNLFERAPPAPTLARIPGSAESLVGWEEMGQPGRDFVTGGPDAAAISAFTGKPALDPVRVYVGRANADTPQERADLALAELIRLGAFDRKVLVLVSPTGTGWMDPGSHDPLEYMHNGDIATVAVQYSYLQSPFALLFETRTGLDQASATISTIYDYWTTLPADRRPRLYIHGLSLGAWSSMYATTLFQLVNDPIDGAFWAGPPFPSEFWNKVQHGRNKGTPWVLPKIGDGSLIRYSAPDENEAGYADWGDMRMMFLQYPSDPIVFFDPLSALRPPVWMREPPGRGVSPYLRFMPIVTQFQLALDMALSTAAPAGYGHAYYAHDYIDPWVEVTAPEDWTAADTERLKAHCDNGFQNGCSNGGTAAE